MPKSVPLDKKRSQQLLVRITEAELRVLESASHLNGVSTSKYAYELLRAHLSVLAADEFVRRDLANRAEFDRADATVMRLTEPRTMSTALSEATPEAKARPGAS